MLSREIPIYLVLWKESDVCRAVYGELGFVWLEESCVKESLVCAWLGAGGELWMSCLWLQN